MNHAALALLALLLPSTASAGVPYQVQWLFTEENPACEPADLTAHDGEAFFRVNDTPLFNVRRDGTAFVGNSKVSLGLAEINPPLARDIVNLGETQLYQTILAFGGAMSTIGDGVAAYADVMQTLVTATSRIGVGFVPFVGPALDLCECVTGKAWCLPSGKELSTKERVFAGAGVAIGGVGHYFAGVKNAGVSPAATLIAGEVAKVDEVIAKGLHANPRTWYKTLRGVADSKPLNTFEIVAGRSMQEQGRSLIGIGDNGVRNVLGMKAVEKEERGAGADSLRLVR